MTNPEKIDVFISRKSQDAKYAKQIYDYLEKEGLKPFDSDHSLRKIGNAEYSKAIDGVLEKTTHLMVVASSREHLESNWVEAEWRFFLNRKRSGKANGNLFTVICSDMQLDQVPASLQNYEVIPFNKKNFPTIYNYCKSKEAEPKPQPPKHFSFNDGNWFKKATVILFILLLAAVSVTTFFVTRPFDATVFLKVKPNLNLSNSYPPFEKGSLSFFINGKEEKKAVLENGEVNFRQLDYASKNKWIQAKYTGKYWSLEQDSMLLGSEINLNVIPDGSLANLSGRITNENGESISDVKVEIDTDTLTYTDSNGNFKIVLPYRMQKRKYKLYLTHENYIPYDENYDYYPTNPKFEPVMTKKK